MFRKIALSLAIAAGFAGPLAASAEAAIGDGALGLRPAAAQLAPVEKVQWVYGGQGYCWYPDGWHGPGFYVCGSSAVVGVGWGGGYGWNGWGGGYARGWNGYGWHPGYVYRGGGYGYHGVYGYHGAGVYHGAAYGFHGGAAGFHGAYRGGGYHGGGGHFRR
jgi:hypothetical protein